MVCLYFTALGIDHPSCPESTKFVRGWNYPCGTFCFPIDKYSNGIINSYLLCCHVVDERVKSLIYSKVTYEDDYLSVWLNLLYLQC